MQLRDYGLLTVMAAALLSHMVPFPSNPAPGLTFSHKNSSNLTYLVNKEGAFAVSSDETPPPSGARGLLLGFKLDPNRAGKEELKLVPGVGEAMSEAIIAKREELGGFKTLEELSLVKGVGPKKFNELSKWYEINPVKHESDSSQ